jgi:uncharacterized membrane protein YhiD involved in acid resistance
MLDWLGANVVAGPQPALGVIAARVALSLVFGAMAALLHRWCRAGTEPRHGFATTLVLLSVLIALVTMVIGDSVARAFGLVGALSIVRFRTVVEDTRDTAFVIFAVAVGMALGAGYPSLPAVGIPAVAIVVAVMRLLGRVAGRTDAEYTLALRTSLGVTPDAVFARAENLIASRRLTAASTVKQGAALETHFEVVFAHGVDPLRVVAALHVVEGVQSVEIKES